MTLRYLVVLSAVAVVVQATTCVDLCQKFGDPVGCERQEAGERDCTLPRSMRTKTVAATPVAAARSTVPNSVDGSGNRPAADHRRSVDHFHTRWKRRGSIRTRFAMVVGDERIDFVGEAIPPLDPYFVRFSSRHFESDHILDNDADCQMKREGNYLCTDRYTQEVLTVVYHRSGPRAFDLRIFRGESTDPREQTVRLSSDGTWVTMDMYANGRPIPSARERYRIAR